MKDHNHKSVLYIGVGTPWQGGAGYLMRQNMFLQALSECTQLHLALFNFDSNSHHVPFTDSVTSLKSPIKVNQSRLKLALADLFSPCPRRNRAYQLQHIRQQVKQLRTEKFDAIFAYRIDFAYFAGLEKHPRLLLDIDDPEHRRKAEALRIKHGNNIDWRTQKDLYKLYQFELDVVKSAKVSFVCQQNDADAFAPAQPIVIPNCVDLPDTFERCENEFPTLLFVGNMQKNFANIDGLKWFVKSVFPIIRQQIPTCQLHLVGDMNETLQSIIPIDSPIKLLGFVEDLEKVYARSWISLAPIRFGTGTRIKILEALAYGCPVVSTSKGYEGIEAIDGKHLLAGNSEIEFAQACIDLLKNAEKRWYMGQASYQLISQKYNLSRQKNRLIELFNEILSY